MTSSSSDRTGITVFYGAVINPISLDCFSALPHCLLAIDPSGKIEWMIDEVKKSKLQETLEGKGLHIGIDIVTLKDGEFLMPGFIDTHTHAPQFPIMGTGNQLQLLEWLETLVFPTESKFDDIHFARKTYESVVRRVLDFGTTTCCYYGSLHLEATKILADIAHAYGQRAFIGKCNMNRESPHYYIESSVPVSLENTRLLISYIRGLHHRSNYPDQEPLVQPILTPRFAISCTPELLTCLGSLAKEDPNLRIQTHISENEAEVEKIRELFPNLKSYADVYDFFGLLRHNTILGHAVHLTDHEVELIKERGAGISHCPTSNFNLNSGIARVGYFLDRGVKVGLGTDVSGGYSPSILVTIQNANIAAKALSFKKERPRHPCGQSNPTNEPHHGRGHDHDHKGDHDHHHDHDNNHHHHHRGRGRGGRGGHDHHHHHHHHEDHEHEYRYTNRALPISALLYLATAGGAAVCNLENKVGSFGLEKSFDAIIVNVREDNLNPGLWGPNGSPTAHDSTVDADADADVVPEEDEKVKLLKDRLERFLLCGDDRNIEKVYVQGRFVGGRAFGA